MVELQLQIVALTVNELTEDEFESAMETVGAEDEEQFVEMAEAKAAKDFQLVFEDDKLEFFEAIAEVKR